MSDRSFIVWRDEFSVGSKTLDTQHKGMFDLINTLYAGMQDGLEHKWLHSKLQEARQYAETHFSHEERTMRDHDFPDFAQHRNAHKTYAQRMDDFLLQFRMTEADLSFDFLKFLKDWWITHILKMDREYAPFLGPGENTVRNSKGNGDDV